MKDRTAEAVAATTSMVNGDRQARKEFVEGMAKEHRTLQQGFTGVCFEWIQHLASLQPGEYDLRNEAAVKACKKIMEGVDKYDLQLPYI